MVVLHDDGGCLCRCLLCHMGKCCVYIVCVREKTKHKLKVRSLPCLGGACHDHIGLPFVPALSRSTLHLRFYILLWLIDGGCSLSLVCSLSTGVMDDGSSPCTMVDHLWWCLHDFIHSYWHCTTTHPSQKPCSRDRHCYDQGRIYSP